MGWLLAGGILFVFAAWGFSWLIAASRADDKLEEINAQRELDLDRIAHLPKDITPGELQVAKDRIERGDQVYRCYAVNSPHVLGVSHEHTRACLVPPARDPELHDTVREIFERPDCCAAHEGGADWRTPCVDGRDPLDRWLS